MDTPDTTTASSTAPAAGVLPAAAVPTPALGGSYLHDPATGTLTQVERTDDAKKE